MTGMRSFCKRALFAVGCVPLGAIAAGMLPDGDFEKTSRGEITGWRTTSAAGRVLAPGKGVNGTGAIGVEGAGTNNCKWLSPPVKVRPGAIYGMSVLVNADVKGGSLTMGTPEMNVTESILNSRGKWVERKTVVFTSDNSAPYSETFRLGEYRVTGSMLFDNARVFPLKPVYENKNGLVLGHGERIAGRKYTFTTQWGREPRAHSRPLHAVR
ncbi:MAG: hypothetical protein IKK82_14180, partial [Kiritimatiellae bacterium]|nr:hypothetical protein [Kiritimatiellia bacterium]